jgi:serine/threonine protein phosphatase PrpC
MTRSLQVGLIQTQGARETQQDFAAIRFLGGVVFSNTQDAIIENLNEPFIGVVCDGMGGHVAGELAARIVCEKFVSSQAFNMMGADCLADGLYEACFEANNALRETQIQNPYLGGMGSTLIGVSIQNSRLSWISVGDSILLLYRRGKILRLNADHSMRPILSAMVDKGFISKEEYLKHPDRNALRSVLNGDNIDLIDAKINEISLNRDDLLLCCSDGVLSIPDIDLLSFYSRWSFFGMRISLRRVIKKIERMKVIDQDNVTILAIRVR